MSDETDDDLIDALLAREEPLGKVRERKALEAVGRMLIAASGFDDDTYTTKEIAQIDGYTCFMLGHMLLDGSIRAGAPYGRDRTMACWVGMLSVRRGTWDAAVSETARHFHTSDSTVKRAWAKYRKDGEEERRRAAKYPRFSGKRR